MLQTQTMQMLRFARQQRWPDTRPTVLKGTNVELGGQDCHAEVKGAFTGDVSAQMWKDIGAGYVIVGHSERRAAYSETDEIVKAKAQSAMDAGLVPIICIGESLDERETGQTLDILGRQLEGSVPEDGKSKPFVVAYEPIWAIGTGLTPTLEQINDAHAFIRHTLSAIVEDAAETTPLLYGGSVKPGNASEILAIQDVNGALVGGASLKSTDFLGIINAA